MLIIGLGTTETLLSTHFFACETCGRQGAHELVRGPDGSRSSSYP